MRSPAAHALLPHVVEDDPARIWFGQHGYVQRIDDDTYHVFMGGGSTLLGGFEADDVATRDVLSVIVVRNLGDSVVWADVAEAFRVGRSTLGRAMQRFHAGGLAAVADTGHKGGLTKRTPQLERRAFKLFDEGLGVRAAHRVMHKRVSYGTVQALHCEWIAKRAEACAPAAQLELASAVAGADAERTQGLSIAGNDNGTAAAAEPEIASQPSCTESAVTDDGAVTGESTPESDAAAVVGGSDSSTRDEQATAETTVADPLGLAAEPSPQALARKERTPEELIETGRSAYVQHAGSWTLLVLLRQLGIYDEAAQWCGKVSPPTLRVVIDMVAIALANGQSCVEGVRRLETPSAKLLLRHGDMLGPSWVRRVLGRFAGEAALMFRARVSATLLRRSASTREYVWLYVDNHPRQYTGKETIRKIWRMQSKRAVPGTMDYYVHDEDGHPVWRVTATDHEPLSKQLVRVVDFSRMVLGEDAPVMLSFDRGASHPETLAGLRDAGVGFVTYEKKPYTPLPETAFDNQLEIVLPSRPKKPIVIRYTEAPDKNLRKKRGRVRRIALLTEDGTQINLLTHGDCPAEEVIRCHLARWGKQENQFKHGAARWGINQLDGRKVDPYPAHAVIPNPDRRRIEHKIKLARAAEGRARCELAELAADDAARERLINDVEQAVARREDLEALRPTMPARAPVEKTSLSGKLVRHTTEYKDVLDTLRIAFANIEADLAVALAPHLERPREAKKVVANLLAAPGSVSLGKDSWRVRLMPAANADERRALARLLAGINRQRLALPGDPTGRPVHFSLQGGPDR
jgi:Transposase protein